ncbi:Uncharacterized protein XB16_2156 [Leptospira santarosai]|uniref:Uncharacterized protein n=1 Tax=Leptospira santarosai TaxID=28183 RepID=A0A2P1QU96_9LEPT|nr:Uncharacterized protein XB16_2156 [Leptospira santarosai]
MEVNVSSASICHSYMKTKCGSSHTQERLRFFYPELTLLLGTHENNTVNLFKKLKCRIFPEKETINSGLDAICKNFDILAKINHSYSVCVRR